MPLGGIEGLLTCRTIKPSGKDLHARPSFSLFMVDVARGILTTTLLSTNHVHNALYHNLFIEYIYYYFLCVFQLSLLVIDYNIVYAYILVYYNMLAYII